MSFDTGRGCPDGTIGTGTGSVNVPVGVVCDTVVMFARNGRRKVGGRMDLASRNERRSD
jgi:hypothetical protein